MIAADITPFVSLEEMRSAHSVLLESLPDEHLSAQELAQIYAFLKRGAASGAHFDSAATRRAAQGMLDYWTATLHGTRRQDELDGEDLSLTAPRRILRGEIPPATHYLLASYDPGTVGRLAKEAERFTDVLSTDDREVLRRVALHLVRLSPELREAITIPVSRKELESVGPKASKIIQRLFDIGILRSVDDPSAGDRVALAQDALTRHWSQLASWIDERRRFRQAVQVWAAHARDPATLIRGRILEAAYHFPDLDGQEREFLEAARLNDRRGTQLKSGLIVVLAALTLVAVLVGLLARRQNFELQANTAQIEKLNADLKRQNDELVAQRDDLRQQAEKTRGKFEALLPTIQDLLKDPKLTEGQRKSLNDLAEEIGVRLDSPASITVAAVSLTLEPGAGLAFRLANGMSSQGTAGFFLQAKNPSRKAMLAPRYLFDSPGGTKIFRIGRLGDTPTEKDLIATIPASKTTSDELNDLDLVAVELPAGLEVRNVVPSVGPLIGVANINDLIPGREVVLAGLGSGTKRGKIRRFDAASGILITDRISTAGDAGAPVVTQDGRAVGILVASKGKDESRVATFSSFSQKNPEWQFLGADAAQANSLFDGAIVQFIASESQAALIPKLESVVREFRKLGMGVPDDGILKRKRTPSAQTEVRYYHEDDRKLADKIKDELTKLLNIDARISRVIDETPPPKFIQVSLSIPDLEKAVAFLAEKK